MTSQTEEKEMLLTQFYNISLQIYDMFSKMEIDEALNLITRKDKIIDSLSRLNHIKSEEFKELQEKIKKQEEKNLEFSIKIKDEIEKKLKVMNKKTQMSNLYAKFQPNGTIVDILE